ncbi:hypothetical protein [Agromyces sp. LHK192]|uniref:hypothetical protein n=1 Tax=Agromyces sp. LHK192 TaxID=2498704 RepID=UPI000FDAE127|nr:hypothetical protein [Agromyces sp. LHK192]
MLISLGGVLAWQQQQLHPGIRTAFIWTAVIVAAAIVYVVFRFRRTEITVSPYGIVERGFFGITHSVPVRDIDSVVRVDLYRGASDETVNQVFVVGHDGRCLVRMRGTFWHATDMDEVATVLDVPEHVRSEPVSKAELHATDSKLLYWFERPFIG